MDSSCCHPQVVKSLLLIELHQRSTIHPYHPVSIIYPLLSRFVRDKIDPCQENPIKCCIEELLQNNDRYILYKVHLHEKMSSVQNIQYLATLYKILWFFLLLHIEILQTGICNFICVQLYTPEKIYII